MFESVDHINPELSVSGGHGYESKVSDGESDDGRERKESRHQHKISQLDAHALLVVVWGCERG
eukprot:TRINITY_DN1316_c0_g1_i4.p7 TRINITY_DN1316_c0_g1~~TRINITY_DN1316_c0_g1_i4.p7  ORF type:complete len:63 (-),score=17.47 TRINITY_DN1316_c0_g1_i4:276-464(-)